MINYENENCCEWYNGQKTVSITFCDKAWINKMKKLHDKYPDEFLTWIENRDGSLFCKVPKKWFAIRHPRAGREFSDEEKAQLAERLRNGRKEQLASTESK